MNANKEEKVLMAALGLLDQGRTPREILDLFPDEREELQKIFETINLLETTKKEILLSPGFGHRIINDFDATSLTKTKRPALSKLIQWQIVAPAAILTIIIALVLVNTNPQTQTVITTLQPDRFELVTIREETAAADFNPELINFLDEESSVQEVDIVLTNL